MSKNKLKRHRNLHAIRLPCPLCFEFNKKGYLVLRENNFSTVKNPLRWDGATAYPDKTEWTLEEQKKWFILGCTECSLKQEFANEKDLMKELKPYLELEISELVKVPSPPNQENHSKNHKRGVDTRPSIFRLVGRKGNAERESTTSTA